MSLTPEIIRGNELTLDTFRAAVAAMVPAKGHMTVDGTIYSQPNLLKKVDAVRVFFKTVRTAKTELKKAFADLKGQTPAIEALVRSLQTATKAYLGENNPDIVKFGFKVNKKPRPLTAEEKKARADKGRMTRELRHTMGSRQKLAIRAVDETPAPTPPAVPVTPSSVTGATTTTRLA